MAALSSLEETDDLFDELTDRFGDLPDAVATLLDVGRLKVYGARYGIASISANKNDEWTLKFSEAASRSAETRTIDGLCLEFENRFRRIGGGGRSEPMELTLRGRASAAPSGELTLRLLRRWGEALLPAGAAQAAGK